MSEVMVLRPATMADADQLLAWRNDVETRHASHNVPEIAEKDHVTWLANTLSSRSRRLLVAEKDGVPMGTVRADLAAGVWELSWTMAPNARGRGLAKQMVALFAHQVSDPIRAEVKVGNIASARIAEYAGMKLDKEIDGVLYYCRE